MNDNYQQLIDTHQFLAKDLLRGHSTRWNEFFVVLGGVSGKGGYLVQHYERRLCEDCQGSSVEDFCQHLQTYLQRKNNYVLITLIETNQHFFSDYFRDVLKDVYRDFFERYGDERLKENKSRKRSNLPPLTKVQIDNDEDFDLHSVIASPEQSSELAPIVSLFARYPRELWKLNQKDFLTLWMAIALKFSHDYVAFVLNFPTANAVAARIRNFKKKAISYSADGTSDSKILNEWLNHSFVLQFAPDSQKWYLNLHIPFDCSAPLTQYIRLELLKNNGSHISHATVKFGNVLCEIKNGWGEMRLSDFHSAIKIKSGYVKVSDRQGHEIEIFPVYQTENIPHTVTEDVFEKWSTHNTDSLRFIADFGMGFAWLLNRNMDYERYGAPKKFDYADLSVVPGEALVLFATDRQNSNSALPTHGFVLPLEWRYLPEYDNPYSSLLPQALIDLGKKIAVQHKVSRGWGLHPSYRFFHDRVDFSKQTVFGANDETVASAYLSLSAALILAVQKYTVPSKIFASAQYDWQNESLKKINLLENKMLMAANWFADPFFVARNQQTEAEQIISGNKFSFDAIGCDSGKDAAFHFLEPLRPVNISPLKTVQNPEYKQHRPQLMEALSALVNASWDKKDKNVPKRNSFVILSGNPGMGKSILMSDLRDRYLEKHTIFSFACNAGDKNCAENFVKSISYQIAGNSSAFAVAALNNLSNLADSADVSEQYRKLVYEPLVATADQNNSHRYYILVDGLDEDASGTICRLLTDKAMQFPANYAVVVSTRPVEPLWGNLRANATGVLDLSAEEFSVSCKKDLKKFIINYIYSDENVSRCWQDANYNDDELREKIGSKDRSFLYAQYVLQGVADGMYHFDQLDKELPAGLTAFYEQSFSYRFATEAEYNVVRPLLKLLLENDSVTIEDASAVLQQPVGKLVKLLQGYCVVCDNTLSLSDATLREWLRDSIKNPDFSIF